MSFNSLMFIFLFLPISVFIYNILNDKVKIKFLIVASIIFYSFGSFNTLLLILTNLIINYFISYCITKKSYKKKILILGLISNIAFLFYYKYLSFFTNNILNLDLVIDFAIPLGLSYITFQQISYLVDIYKEKVKLPQFENYTLYILFFPKLIAGPICTFKNFNANQFISSNSTSLEKGIYRFSIGLGKKVIIASTLQNFVDIVYSSDITTIPTLFVWLAIFAYSLQIYFDFSGYTDMALGIADLFSISLPENFNKPYKAINITDFWKRWHMSLTTFLKNYIYIPLGGSRCSKKRWAINTLIVFLISGLWHGASFTFIVWGLYHGIFILLDKVVLKKVQVKLPNFINIICCFITVSIGWIFFRAENLSSALAIIKALFNFNNLNLAQNFSTLGFDFKFIFMLILAFILIFIKKITLPKNMNFYLSRIASLFILIYSLAIIASGSFKPFIYFNF